MRTFKDSIANIHQRNTTIIMKMFAENQQCNANIVAKKAAVQVGKNVMLYFLWPSSRLHY